MKTAMQELIEDLSNNMVISIFERLEREGLFIKALEKEKEQIINAFEVGYKSCDMDEAFEINRKLASGEQYFNKTYK